MKLSWRWLSQFVDTAGIDPVAFANRFTCTVAEIDGLHRVGPGLESVVVADIVAVAPHPNADKLRLATVDIGNGQSVTVVCGAPNVRVGLRVPFVPGGVTLPSGQSVRDGEVRGVHSPGMLASERDLGLSDDHAGLLELDGCDAATGTPIGPALGLDDVLYEVDNKSVTHRPDLWGLHGMAREVAAMLDRPLRPLQTEVTLGAGDPVALAVDAGGLCLRYLCARIQGLAVAPSPVHLRLLLRRLGVRPISNVVDATNLVMLETGNPLHAFDARFLRGGAIVVRKAIVGETIRTLDGNLRVLQTSDCVIADAEGPIALAGIMGGADSEIRADTHDVVLEAAAFDPNAIRKTAMRLGMRSESSARFEKALDPGVADVAARRFLRLVLELSPGARVVSSLADAGPLAGRGQEAIVLHTRATLLRQRLGVTPGELPDAWMDACYGRLGFTVARSANDSDALTVTVPPWRATRDVTRPEDLIEELGRHFGYGNVKSEAPKVAARPPVLPPLRRLERAVRQALVHGAGLSEVMLYGFDDATARDRLGLHDDGERLQVQNAIASELSLLRRNLAPNLLAAAERNLLLGDGQQASKKGFQVAIFELGRAFVPVPRRPLSEAETARLDFGVPAVLIDDTRRDGYLAAMESEMRSGTADAFARRKPLPWQPLRLGIVLAERLGGGAEGAKFAMPPKDVTERLWGEVVAALDLVAHAAGLPPMQLRRDDVQDLPVPVAAPDRAVRWLHPARHGLVLSGGQAIGHVTALHPAVRQNFAAPCELVLAEVDLQALVDQPRRAIQGHAPHPFPAVGVDLTVHVPLDVGVGDVVDAFLARDRRLTDVRVELVDHYAWDDPAACKRAVTLRVSCRADGRTLSDEDVAGVRSELAAFDEAWATVRGEGLAPLGAHD
jgi:phenylalanyl-tRNA synthetase beta chain